PSLGEQVGRAGIGIIDVDADGVDIVGAAGRGVAVAPLAVAADTGGITPDGGAGGSAAGAVLVAAVLTAGRPGQIDPGQDIDRTVHMIINGSAVANGAVEAVLFGGLDQRLQSVAGYHRIPLDVGRMGAGDRHTLGAVAVADGASCL